jgi:tetratricopeptide (TPR) repeat protein
LLGLPGAAQDFFGCCPEHFLVDAEGAFAAVVMVVDRADDEEDDAGRDAAVVRLAEHSRAAVLDAADVLYPHLLHVPAAWEPDRGTANRFPDSVAALAWLDAESANLVAMAGRLNALGHHRVAWDVAHLTNGYFMLRVDTVTWQSMAEAASVAAYAGCGPAEQAMAELQLGMLLVASGRTERAAEHSARAAELARAAGWIECHAVALNNLARCHWLAGRIDDTIDQLAMALVSHRDSRRRAGEAVTLANLGAAYVERSRGQTDDADRRSGLEHAKLLLDQALTVHRSIGDRRNEAETLRVLAEVYRDLDEQRPALSLAVAALGTARETADTRTEIGALSTLATVQVRLGNTDAGLDYHNRALRLADEKDQQHMRAQALLDQADSFVRLGQPEAAFFAAQDALVIAQRTGSRLFESCGRRLLAMIPPIGKKVLSQDSRAVLQHGWSGR